jgi:hypothetical protein
VPLDRATGSFPWIIEPDEEVRTRVTYAPDAKGQEVAYLHVTSNDPDQPLTTTEIHATAGVANVEDVYQQPDLPAADILFVIDDSTSMDDEQAGARALRREPHHDVGGELHRVAHRGDHDHLAHAARSRDHARHGQPHG